MADMMDIILAKALSGNGSGGEDPALDRRVTALEEEFGALLDEEGKVKEDCLPELGGSDPRVDELMEDMAAIFGEDGKIKESYLPEEWVSAKVEEYVGEALGGEY